MYARIYAQIIGVVLTLVGVVGLVLGNVVWLGILNVDIVEDIVHLITGDSWHTWASGGWTRR